MSCSRTGRRLLGGACTNDAAFMEHIADELTQLAGVPREDVSYYQIQKRINHDPLYGEVSSSESYSGPFNVAITIEFDEGEGNYSQTSDDEGVEREYDANASVSVVEWRQQARDALPPLGPALAEPSEGDVLSVFDGEDRRWFDVLRVERTGYVNQTPRYTQWKLICKSRSAFTPDRRLQAGV